MAAGGERKSSDFYSVLGLEKECTPTELKNAYKKLAMRWHPDRFSASGNSKSIEEAKKRFQAIQEAYSVLSDETKRFLYDFGVYDNDDDENNNGMGDFLNEMADMMRDSKPNESGEESFEQLQDLFNEMFPNSVQSSTSTSQGSTLAPSCSSSNIGSMETSFINNSCKRNSTEMNNPEGSSSSFDAYFQNILVGGVEESGGGPGKGKGAGGGTRGGGNSTSRSNSNNNSRRRRGQKQKVSSGHDVSSNDVTGVST